VLAIGFGVYWQVRRRRKWLNLYEMPLTLRSSNLAPPVYEHMGDYEALDDGQSIGRIYAGAGQAVDQTKLDEKPRRLPAGEPVRGAESGSKHD
jgi:hypothetical protein